MSEAVNTTPLDVPREGTTGSTTLAGPEIGLGPVAESVKRGFDVAVALLALALLAPLLVVTSLVVWRSSPGGALFRQVRVGQHGRPFTMWKFRTMHVGTDDEVHRAFVTRQLRCGPAPGPPGPQKLTDDPRITRVGHWLRRTSIDELPQLVNVVRGDMSLVGPRPSLPYEVALYHPRHHLRFAAKPGLTGLWQVRGRSRVTMNEALELDLEYVRAQCLSLDLRILLLTVPALFRVGAAR